MMKSIKKKGHIRIREALAAAYREKEKAHVCETWQAGAMNRIRRLGPLKSKMSYFEFFEQFVWRLAPAACVLILILAAVFIHMDFISEYEMAKIFFEDPVDFPLFQSTDVS